MSDNNRFKFRVWDVQEQKFMYFDLSDKGSLSDFEYFATEECPDYNEQIRCPDANCWALIIEQCTGLTDKNGKLIYEGDIFKATVINSFPGDKCLNQTIIGQVSYYTKECAFAFSAYNPINLFKIEIIGNIHEDAELLQCEKNS